MMGKIKTFWQSLVRSTTKPAYYGDILSAKFSFSVKYLAFLLFIISTIWALRFAFGLISIRPKIPYFVQKIRSVITDIYPSDLVITVRNKKIVTNVKEPYFIDMPESGKELELGGMHLMVIDTKGKIEDYKKYNSAILLTSESVVIPDDQNSEVAYRVYPLSDLFRDVPDGAALNKGVYQAFASQILPFIEKIPSYLFIFGAVMIILWPFVGMVFGLSGRMFYLVFSTAVLWVVAKIMKRGLSYTKIYQLSMHGLTLPILISTVISLFGRSVPFLFSVVFLIFMSVVLTKMPAKVGQTQLA